MVQTIKKEITSLLPTSFKWAQNIVFVQTSKPQNVL